MRTTPTRARSALLHPVWLGSLALLVLNDHVLKGAGALPQVVTGKLSDFVGMLVAPAVLACLLRLRSDRAWAAAHVAIGVVFAAINVSPAAAAAFEWLTALTPLPWAVTVDPTDLVALPMLLVSYRLFGGSSHREQPSTRPRVVLQGAALTAGALACMGTSPPCDGNCGGATPLDPMEEASLTLGNHTAQQRLVRVRPLKDSVLVDCDVLMDDPTSATHRDMFAPAEAWLLEPGRALPLRARRAGCQAFLVDAQGLPMTLIAWFDMDFPAQVLPTDVNSPEVNTQNMIMMRGQGSELLLDEHTAVFDAPRQEVVEPEPACAVPDETVGLAWSDLPTGTRTLLGITSSPDGCHDVELEGASFYVCLPLETLPFEIGEQIDLGTYTVTNTVDEDGTISSATGIVITGDSHVIRAVRGAAVLSPSTDTTYDISVETQPGCVPHHDACGNYVTPLEVTFLGSGIVSLDAGDSAQREADGSTLHLVRAQELPIRDTACTTLDTSQGARYFESVLVTPQTPEL